MARVSLTLSLALLSLFLTLTTTAQSATTTAAAANPATSFIRTSCRVTTYPTVCERTLQSHAATIQKSPKQLVTTALSVSVDAAHSTKAFVQRLSKFSGLKPKERAAIKDCLEQVSDGADRLSKAAHELANMGRARGAEFIWHMSNLQTWVSAALTDDSTCLDGFSGRAMDGRIKSSIRARVTNVVQVTSNALALCNKFAGKY